MRCANQDKIAARLRAVGVTLAVLILPTLAHAAPDQGDTGSSKTAGTGGSGDQTQSIISPLGLGSGGTLSVAQKGTTVSASVEGQLSRAVVNFWQVGTSGTTNTNGQATVYSSTDAGAPGFKAKIGAGYSSFLATDFSSYTGAGANFQAQVWCIRIAAVLSGKTDSQGAGNQPADCGVAAKAASDALEKSNSDQKAKDLNQKLLTLLQDAAGDPQAHQQAVCSQLKNAGADAYKLCPDSGQPIPTVEELRGTFPKLYAQYVTPHAPPTFYYKVSLNWSPTLVTTDYRAVVNGTADLATNKHWSNMLSSFALDAAAYYAAWSFGLELGYGKTVNIVQQSVCTTTMNGTYSTQQCKNAMIGEPDPMSTTPATAAAVYTPAGSGVTFSLLRPGIEVLASVEKPSGASGHKSQLAIPLFVAPINSPMKFVVGLQPTWTWNSEPKQQNDFSVLLYVGARPSATK